MKHLLKTPLFIICLIFALIIGGFVGYGISNDFVYLYMSKLTQIPTRYILMILIVVISCLIFNQLSHSTIILRQKSLFNLSLYMLKIEIIALCLIFTIFHLPIFLLNSAHFFDNLFLIVKVIINAVVVSLLLTALIKLVDIKLKSRAISSGIILVVICIIDILLGHFNFFVINEPIFDFSHIFVLSYMYKNYYILVILIVVVIFFLLSLFIYLSLKKDYFLRGIYEEN
ncbi:MAG: hypothetical protein PHC65_06070 [Methanobacteriaceae archaeon]|nr:hypothetical protein [Methanobacteriaceae archaeon]MDD3408479.1 hypothetical protein [Methanobacteriaceae archaeon]